MRIEKLRLVNLNSLYGQWEIDFTHPAYIEDGIFAITGATGAGKSTLLDAVCLALYGTTPRLGRITQSANQLMSRGRGECCAELTFTASGKRYRSFWEQHRARKKADGNLTDPRHELADGDSGKILFEKKRDTQQAIEEITGMDFQRFTRSMMLAQGGFDAFLKAQPDERAPILEQITGTEIYSAISKAVHERNREERERLNLLQAETAGVELLEPEVEADLRRDLSALENKEVPLEKKLRKDLAVKKELADFQNLQVRLNQRQQEQKDLESRWTDFLPLQDQLENSRKAQSIAPFHSQWRLCCSRINEEEAQKNQLTEELPRIEQEQLKQQKSYDQLQKKLESFKALLQQKRGLWNKVRKLDEQLSERKRQLRELCTERETRQEQGEKNLEKIEGCRQSLEGLSQLLESTETKTPPPGDWTTLLPVIKEQWNIRSARMDRLEQIDSSLALSARTLEDLQQEQRSVQKEVEKTESALSRLTEELSINRKRLKEALQGKLLREYRQDLKHLNQQMELLRVISTLEEQRSQLKDGSPCPLCGSTEHPYALGNVPSLTEEEQNRRDLEQLIETLEGLTELTGNQEGSLKEITEKKRSLGERLNYISENLRQNRASLEEKKQQQKQSLDELNQSETLLAGQLQSLGLPEDKWLGRKNLIKELEDLNRQQEEQKKIREQKEQEKKKLEEQLKEWELLQKTIEQRLQEFKQTEQQQNEQLQQLASQRKELLDDKDPDKEEASMEEQQSEQERELQTGRELKEQWNRRLEEANYRLSSLIKSLANLGEEEEQLSRQFTEKLSQAGFNHEEDFLACRLSEEEQMRLAREEEELKRGILLTGEALKELERLFKEGSEQLKEAPPMEELETKITHVSEELKQLREESGGLKEKLSRNEEAIKRIAEKGLELEQQKKECTRWEKLHRLIGSNDGKKYRNFVQGLTFQRMILQANRQLREMNDRYLLIGDESQPLELNVIDNYQAGEVRSTRNLSGGESFIISLALALGLSGLSGSKVPMESLFLDEGFGTLDDESLDTALTALSELQQRGKMIGIISHVPALKDRISTRIRVHSTRSGYSRMEGPGCSEIKGEN